MREKQNLFSVLLFIKLSQAGHWDYGPVQGWISLVYLKMEEGHIDIEIVSTFIHLRLHHHLWSML